jgi:hypothetical protein
VIMSNEVGWMVWSFSWCLGGLDTTEMHMSAVYGINGIGATR